MHLESEGAPLKTLAMLNKLNGSSLSHVELTDSCVSAASYYSMAPGGAKLEKKHRISSYKLESRPGMQELLQRFPDQKLAASIADGYKLSLNSLMYSHQKIVQLFNILVYTGGEWDDLYKAFKNSDDLQNWHKNYLQSIATIEEMHLGLFKTLCSLLANTLQRVPPSAPSSLDTPSLYSQLQSLKEHTPCPVDTQFLPWGRGSTVHSLADALFLFCKDNKVLEALKGVFVRDAQHTAVLKDVVEDKVLAEVERVEKVFEEEDVEFAVERFLENEHR